MNTVITIALRHSRICFLRRKLGGYPTTVERIQTTKHWFVRLQNTHRLFGSLLKKNIKIWKQSIRSPRALFWVTIDVSRQFRRSFETLNLEPRAVRGKILRLKCLYLIYNGVTDLDSREYLMPPPHRSSRINHGKAVSLFLAKHTSFKYSFLFVPSRNRIHCLSVDSANVREIGNRFAMEPSLTSTADTTCGIFK